MTMIEKLRAGNPVFGTMLRIQRDPAVIPIAQSAGLDFAMLDLEHGSYSIQTMADLALTGRCAGFPLLVRVPELARGYVSRALDCGIVGVMVPMVESVEQAKRLVEWAKYPPLGGRGLSSQGGHTVFRRLDNPAVDMPRLNTETLAIAQIETAAAIDCIEGIAAVPGIDVLLIGPNDLAVSLGKPGKLDSPEELAAIARVGAAAKKYGKIFGMHAGAASLAPWVSHGMTFFMNAIDTGILQKGLAEVNQETRKLIRPAN